jgi:hypothetical protein
LDGRDRINLVVRGMNYSTSGYIKMEVTFGSGSEFSGPKNRDIFYLS